MQLWLIGGYVGGNFEKTTVFAVLNGTSVSSSPGPDLPENFVEPCASYINASLAIITSNKPARSYIVDLNNDFAITKGPPFAKIGYLTHHGCTRFMHRNGTNFVVLAGVGLNHDETEITSEANLDSWMEGNKYHLLVTLLPMYNFHDCSNIISIGPKIPRKCYGGRLIPSPDGQGAIILGCRESFSDGKMFKLSWNNEDELEWTEMSQKTKYPRRSAVAMYIQIT